MTYTEDDLTPVFPAHVKPVHVGVYKVRMYLNNGTLLDWVWAMWNGKEWSWGESTPKLNWVFNHNSDQDKQWRGLRKEPK